MIFHLIQVRKIQIVNHIQAVLCVKVKHEEVSNFLPSFVPHSLASPRFAFLGSSGVSIDFDNQSCVLECFQKFIDEDVSQLFAGQTNMYANQFLAANASLKP